MLLSILEYIYSNNVNLEILGSSFVINKWNKKSDYY